MQTQPYNRRRLLQLFALTMTGAALPAATALAAGETLTVGDMQDTPLQPVYLPASGGKQERIGAGSINFNLNKQQTSGLLGSTETVLPPGLLGAPPHSHQSFDEVCRVLEGTLTILVGKQVYHVHAGDWHLRPRGIMHCFWNAGKVPAKFIELYIPGGHEAYMSDLADLFINQARPHPQDLDRLAQRYDIHFDWDQLPGIMEKYKVKL